LDNREIVVEKAMTMNITLLEPYNTGSHAAWANEYSRFSRHRVDILSLPGRHWKWRMHGGAVTLARKFLASPFQPDLLLATDMLDLTTFLALTRHKSAQCICAVYFHENQLTYPWSPDDADQAMGRDQHYAFINYATALAADAVLFNSSYHLQSFVAELPRFLAAFPDKNEAGTVQIIREKSRVLSLGMDLRRFDPYRPAERDRDDKRPPLILWNHRWEYDKNPLDFFRAMGELVDKGLDFQLAILGERFTNSPAVFSEAREKLGDRIVHYGFVKDFAAYAEWLWRGDILPVTSHHDFFGGSVVQAMHCNCYPLLPRRLAYPEHIPAEHHCRFIYDDQAELVEKLAGLILNIRATRSELPRQFVARYDWQRLAPFYDDLFEKMVAEGSIGTGGIAG
jgi:glycosyltransferase involved in cell wall biosynthesis